MKKGLIWLLALLLTVPMAAYGQVIMGEMTDAYVEDGRTLATLTAHYPQLQNDEQYAVAQRVNEAISSYVRMQGGYDGVIESASGDYAAGYRDGEEWQYGLDVEAESKLYVPGRFLSVLYWFSAYTGGAHPDNWLAAQQYDLRTGDVVSVMDMVQDEDAFHAAVADMIMAQIKSRGLVDEMGYFEDYETTVRSWYGDQALFAEDGLLVFFSQYELAPYAAGDQRFALPMADIAPYLNETGRELLGK